MKNIIKTILLLFVINSCKAQTFNIMDYQNRALFINGAYYQDINSVLNPFEGTYIYNNGNVSLKFVLQKKISLSSVHNYSEDLIVGEYQYIENGVEIINTLPRLNQSFSDESNHYISSNLVLIGTNLCPDCSPNELHLKSGLVDGQSNNTAELSIRKVVVNGIEAIKILIVWRSTLHNFLAPVPPHPSFPGGEYVLLKQ